MRMITTSHRKRQDVSEYYYIAAEVIEYQLRPAASCCSLSLDNVDNPPNG